MSLESLGAPVGEVAADLAGVADVQTMQLVQPVRDGLKQQDIGWSLNGMEPQC